MLTGDLNIAEVKWIVQYKIVDPVAYLFNVRNPLETIRDVSEATTRLIVGDRSFHEALQSERRSIADKVRVHMQLILDKYDSGISIQLVQLQDVHPPTPVADSFNEVNRAKQDQERSINEATAYRNNIVPRAKGQAEKMVQDASAYKEKVIKEADGEAKRFLSVYETYKDAKDVTRLRLYLERMQSILKSSNKMIIDQEGGSGVVPYLPLNELQKSTKGATQ